MERRWAARRSRMSAAMEAPASLAAFARRAVHIAGPNKHIILTMATGGYADFARSWARGLDLINVSHFLVATDDVALAELSMLGGHVEPVYEEGLQMAGRPGPRQQRRPAAGAFRAR